jgi:hypothetical protein
MAYEYLSKYISVSYAGVEENPYVNEAVLLTAAIRYKT